MLKNGNTTLKGQLTLTDGTDSYTLPNTDGSANQVLTTDGFGAVSWQDQDYDADWTEMTTPANYIKAKAGGIATNGATLYGTNATTHINLGFDGSVSGTSGSNWEYITIGGGRYNRATYKYSTIGGGYQNLASNQYTFIGGGYNNQATGERSTIGGGTDNTAATYATIGGGITNTASGAGATIAGGQQNTATADYATVSGGWVNHATGTSSVIGGGYTNTASGYYATISGGYLNDAIQEYATIGGGNDNTASGLYSTVAGGNTNTAAGLESSVGGGNSNNAFGERSAIPGGSQLKVGNRSFGFRGGIGSSPTTQTDVSSEPETFHIVDTKFHFNFNNADADFRVDGTTDNVFYVDAGTNRVGIGTFTPNQQLEITGNMRIPATTATTGIIYKGANTFIHSYGSENTFIGEQAGNLSMTGSFNVATGQSSLSNNTSGAQNVGNGGYALLHNTTGSYNSALGTEALRQNTAGNNNTASGYNALSSNTSGNNNSATGNYALYSNLTGNYNVALGNQAGYSSVGSSNVFLGNQAGYIETGSNKLYIENTSSSTPLIYGEFDNDKLVFNASATITGNVTISNAYTLPNTDGTAGKVLTTNGSGVVSWQTAGGGATSIDGLTDGKSDDSSIFFGTNSGTNDDGGNLNVGIGKYSLQANTEGSYNIAVGSMAMYNNTSGVNNSAYGVSTLYNNTTGVNNTGLGGSALFSNTTGNFNVAVGLQSINSNTEGSNNTAVGYLSLYSNVDGNSNLALGYKAGYSSTGSGNIFIGYQAGYDEEGSNKLYIDNSSTATPLIYGEFDNNKVVVNASATITNGLSVDNSTASSTTPAINVTAGSGKTILSYGTCSDIANLADMGNYSVIYYTDASDNSIDQNQLPSSGVNGQLLYIVNGRALELTIISNRYGGIAQDEVCVLVYANNKWIQMPH
jgi:hypothetical protein